MRDFQHEHGLEADGVFGQDTSDALKYATLQQSALVAITLDKPQHPGFNLFQQAFTGMGRIDQLHGRATDLATYNLSGAIALGARKSGLDRIDQVFLSEDGTRAIAVQGDIRSPLRRLASVDVVSGVNTSLAQSSADWSLLQAPQASPLAPAPLMEAANAKASQPMLQR